MAAKERHASFVVGSEGKGSGSLGRGSGSLGRVSGSGAGALGVVEDAVSPKNLLSPPATPSSSRRGPGTQSIKDKHAAARLASRARCLVSFRNFLLSKEGPMLRTWFLHFDKSQIGKIGHREFRNGMSQLRYPGDIDGLWADINYDNSDELFFDEVDAEQGALWSDFRRWCGLKFTSPRDMIRQVKKAASGDQPKMPGSLRPQKDVLNDQEVARALLLLGWERGEEATIFSVMDLSGEKSVSHRDLRWLEAEIRRGQIKELAQKRAIKIAHQKARGKRMCAAALADFKAMLRRQYGPLFRAWRRVLDTDGTMSLQRSELFKVCRQLNWQGNMRTLWKALDHDGSGATTFEELDPHGAQLLAEFRSWASAIWGAKLSAPMFRDMDMRGRRKLGYADFARQCEGRGFSLQKAQQVAASLDWKGCKAVQEADFHVFDVWKPPDWLIASPNAKAAEEFKMCLLKNGSAEALKNLEVELGDEMGLAATADADKAEFLDIDQNGDGFVSFTEYQARKKNKAETGGTRGTPVNENFGSVGDSLAEQKTSKAAAGGSGGDPDAEICKNLNDEQKAIKCELSTACGWKKGTWYGGTCSLCTSVTKEECAKYKGCFLAGDKCTKCGGAGDSGTCEGNSYADVGCVWDGNPEKCQRSTCCLVSPVQATQKLEKFKSNTMEKYTFVWQPYGCFSTLSIKETAVVSEENEIVPFEYSNLRVLAGLHFEDRRACRTLSWIALNSTVAASASEETQVQDVVAAAKKFTRKTTRRVVHDQNDALSAEPMDFGLY